MSISVWLFTWHKSFKAHSCWHKWHDCFHFYGWLILYCMYVWCVSQVLYPFVHLLTQVGFMFWLLWIMLPWIQGCRYILNIVVKFLKFNFLFYIGVLLTYNIVLVSSARQSDLALYMYIYPFFLKFFSHICYYRILSRVLCAIQ